ncbi:MAG TPA: histidine kinase [Mycobacteriales bacterium]|jgi:two-component system sensor histidine kinase DesK|nr:histidine kinase [Mycobacteriales bacterium]
MESACPDVGDRPDWASGTGAIPEGWLFAPRLARALVAVVFAGLGTVAVLRIFTAPDAGPHQALAVGYLLVLLAAQLPFLRRLPASYRSPLGATALVAQGALAYLPFLEFGRSWAGMPGFLAGSCLLALPRVAAWTAFVAVVASTACIQDVLAGTRFETAYGTVATVITGLLVYGLARLAALVEELRDARAEVARLAVAGERLRVSRDLHDLIGYSISAIALKSELTGRLIRTSPDQACEENNEVQDISRRALADVRAVARGYREMSLVEEVFSARSMLLAADIRTRVDVSGTDMLPQDVGTVLAIVLRESVTNVLRHSEATTCEIAVRRVGGCVTLGITNDGVTDHLGEGPDGGSGLDSLSARMATVNGRLSTETLSGDRWRLRAVVTLDRQRTPVAAEPSAERAC